LPEVKVRENEPIESALRRFKKQCEKTGILRELKERAHYDKPSIRRKLKAKAAKKKNSKRFY
jgi:small subunit ribosomal protein S21